MNILIHAKEAAIVSSGPFICFMDNKPFFNCYEKYRAFAQAMAERFIDNMETAMETVSEYKKNAYWQKNYPEVDTNVSGKFEDSVLQLARNIVEEIWYSEILKTSGALIPFLDMLP